MKHIKLYLKIYINLRLIYIILRYFCKVQPFVVKTLKLHITWAK